MSDKTVLVLAPFYNFFMKGYIEGLASQVKKIHVFVHYNKINEITRILPPSKNIDYLKKFNTENLVKGNNRPENVELHLVGLTYFKKDGENFKLGDMLYNKYVEIIDRQGIDFDVINAHHTFPRGYVGLKLRERYNRPVVLTVHENKDLLMDEYQSKNDVYRNVWKKSDLIFRVNKFDMIYIRKFNRKVEYLPNGYSPSILVRIDKNKARKHLDLINDSKIVFTLGDLIPRKGLIHLINAMKKIIEKDVRVFCYIGGKGPQRAELEELISEYGLEDNVKLLGFIEDEDLKYWMSASDLFVLSSLSEGNPTVMFESLGIGLPFIGTRVGGVSDIINSEKYGLLVDPGDEKDLEQKISEGLKRDWNYHGILSYGRDFTWENVALRSMKLMEDHGIFY